MALLIGPGTRLIDASGNLISGGKVRVYNRNTTTLSSIYSDAAMGSALTNPCVANASGYPSSDGSAACQIFAASGQYDIAFLDASNNVLASFEDVPTYGEENGDLSRTVTGNGRFLLTGAAGAVLMQAGDPSPDNSGGTLTIEGWAGTQLDSLTLDAATTDTTGWLKEKTKKLLGVIHTQATSFSATNVDIALPEYVDGVREWKIIVYDLVISTSTGNLRGRLSYDGGGTYKSGAADYHSYSVWGAGGGASSTSALASAEMDLATSSAFETASGKPARVEIDVNTPESGTNPTLVTGKVDGWNNGATSPQNVLFTSYGLGSYGRATHIRLYDSAGGTLTGKYVIEVKYGRGEA